MFYLFKVVKSYICCKYKKTCVQCSAYVFGSLVMHGIYYYCVSTTDERFVKLDITRETFNFIFNFSGNHFQHTPVCHVALNVLYIRSGGDAGELCEIILIDPQRAFVAVTTTVCYLRSCQWGVSVHQHWNARFLFNPYASESPTGGRLGPPVVFIICERENLF